ncbi:RNA polymerase sigma-70 factor (ECF subfamily) [Kineococcus xinjiangensis]|uniref:RNA polymerase sigma-70 factor (ECF subfamily) n=1 Tax=Kineococcus xinjiangensis TaxID=512762 RepID=A0A2S6ICC8_9ACTN|nr:ECF RNA polymerase sigma factor SigK [Kineococcus xinjiangensis]PPK90905.1 RNA polymerase sigma-70 factor (ECF subfamily) [Kineococcus xinjiangensis]
MTLSRQQQGEPPGPATAEELLQAAGHGDEQAFAALYDATSGAVFGTVLRVLRDRAQSEEVTQEVYLEAWRTATRFDAGRGSARTWLITMAHRRAVDRVRSAQASADRDERVGLRDQIRPYDSVSEAVELSMEREDVRRALTSLTPVQRQAVALAYYGGRTHTEISRELSLPLGTVKTRLRDGMIRLRDALGVAR